jgi:hypothetical protein
VESSHHRTKEYVHLGQVEVRSISGSYSIEEEQLVTILGQEVLCEIGYGLVDSSCCGTGGCRFAHVAGFVRQYRMKQDRLGRWISKVEPIQDKTIRKRLEELLRAAHMVQQVVFEEQVK